MRKIASPQITARVIFQPEFPVFSTKWWVPVTLTLPSRPQSPSFLGHVVGKRRLQIKPSSSGDKNALPFDR